MARQTVALLLFILIAVVFIAGQCEAHNNNNNNNNNRQSRILKSLEGRRISHVRPLASTRDDNSCPVSGYADLKSDLHPFYDQGGVPAIGAAIVQQGKLTHAGVIGTRRAGYNIPVQINDKWHLGSNTKSMTGVLIAKIIDEGLLTWNSTLSEVFPELTFQPIVAQATIYRLMSHTSGLQDAAISPLTNYSMVDYLFNSIQCDESIPLGNLDVTRYYFVRKVAQYFEATLTPGVNFSYCNSAIVLVGAIIERVRGRTWEEEISQVLFDSLSQRTAGLGNQASPGRVDAPLGHQNSNGSNLMSFLTSQVSDNPIVVGPAGTSHMSVLDYAKYGSFFASAGTRTHGIVKPETLRFLGTERAIEVAVANPPPGTPNNGYYGIGWGFEYFTEYSKFLLAHGGSNQKNLVKMVVDTDRDVAWIVTVNISGGAGDFGGTLANTRVADVMKRLFAISG